MCLRPVVATIDQAKRIADIAAAYGFMRQETFWRAFRRRLGITPGALRPFNSKRVNAK
jgi:AraC-like DNA-binding protein